MSSEIKSDNDKVSLKLAPDDIPEDWYDDQRMDFLYCAFKNRSINPISYDAKINFWKKYIIKYCVYNNIVCFDESKIRKGFERNNKFPACILKVVEALKSDGKVVLYNDLLKHGYKGQSWAAWTTENIVAKPTSFAVGKLWSVLGYGEGEVGGLTSVDKFVCIEALQNEAEKLLLKYVSDPDCVHSTSETLELNTVFKQEGNKELTELCIIWLCKHGKAVVDDTVSPPLIKFGHKANITDIDKHTIQLKKQEALLNRKLHELEVEKRKYMDEAKEYLKKDMRPAAKASLRKKKEIEKRIDKLVDAMTNVSLLTSQVEETESNAKVIESYKAAAAALKSTLKENGLTEDTVASCMDEVEEVLDLHDEVKTMISQPIGPVTVTATDEDYERELEDLLAEPEPHFGGAGDGGSAEDELSFSGLPEVPSTPLSPQKVAL